MNEQIGRTRHWQRVVTLRENRRDVDGLKIGVCDECGALVAHEDVTTHWDWHARLDRLESQ